MKDLDIGIIGLGVMGQNLALNIADKGFSVGGWDAWADPVERLAAKAATDAQLAGIATAYEGMAAAQTTAELLEPDLAFHRRIAEATGNDLLAYIGNMLSLALRESIILSSQLPNTHELSLPRHKAILTALQARDSLGARQATLVQLEETGDDLSTVLAEDGRVNLA